LPELTASHFRNNGVMQNTFAVPEGMVVFLICRAKLPFIWSGREFAPSLMGICRSYDEQWAVIPEGWDCYEFLTSEALIRRSEVFPPEFFAKTTRIEDAYLPLVEPETSRFLKRMDVLFARLRNANRQPGFEVGRAEFLDSVVSGLQQVIDTGLAARGAPPRTTRRADLIAKAKEVMSANLEADFTADDLAQSLGVSYRVLNYACQSNLGMSPYQYLLTEKLHAVRRKLKTSDASVTEASMSCGFSTPSRFARQYKRLFGELPSETRDRKSI
jgi:AraC-like DNA-binding protein